MVSMGPYGIDTLLSMPPINMTQLSPCVLCDAINSVLNQVRVLLLETFVNVVIGLLNYEAWLTVRGFMDGPFKNDVADLRYYAADAPFSTGITPQAVLWVCLKETELLNTRSKIYLEERK
ncbi:hypothetical protein CHUAL_000396 [Chamberlinius hualienensis]